AHRCSTLKRGFDCSRFHFALVPVRLCGMIGHLLSGEAIGRKRKNDTRPIQVVREVHLEIAQPVPFSPTTTGPTAPAEGSGSLAACHGKATYLRLSVFWSTFTIFDKSCKAWKCEITCVGFPLPRLAQLP